MPWVRVFCSKASLTPDVNKHDYRAWYGLGQTYEILEMQHYAVYYYERAAALRPTDYRMWAALGNCYEVLERYPLALGAFLRACSENGVDAVLALRIAQIHEKIGDLERAVAWYRKCVAEDDEQEVTSAGARARLWLAKWDVRDGDYAAAEQYLLPVLNGTHVRTFCRRRARLTCTRMLRRQRPSCARSAMRWRCSISRFGIPALWSHTPPCMPASVAPSCCIGSILTNIFAAWPFFPPGRAPPLLLMPALARVSPLPSR